MDDYRLCRRHRYGHCAIALKHVILIGHSMAGHIVLEAAIHAPGKVIGLVGVENFKHVGHVQSPEEKAGYAQGIEQLKYNFHGIATQYFTQALFAPTTPADVKQRILKDVAYVDTSIAAACMAPDDFDEAAKLATAGKKLYLINSDTKPTDTTGLTAHLLPFQLLSIHDTGHFPMVEKPGDFNVMLDQALSEMAK
jgi:pimeloyl-ACP methyl ester carboxylesterase